MITSQSYRVCSAGVVVQDTKNGIAYVCFCVHLQVNTHTHTHAHTYTHVHAYVHTNTQPHTHVHMCTPHLSLGQGYPCCSQQSQRKLFVLGVYGFQPAFMRAYTRIYNAVIRSWHLPSSSCEHPSPPSKQEIRRGGGGDNIIRGNNMPRHKKDPHEHRGGQGQN